MHGAVGRAVRSWEGQFQKVRDHLESDTAAIDVRQIDAKYPLWQWFAGLASSILSRYVMGPNGSTTFELIMGEDRVGPQQSRRTNTSTCPGDVARTMPYNIFPLVRSSVTFKV